MDLPVFDHHHRRSGVLAGHPGAADQRSTIAVGRQADCGIEF
jgi:hypothetical protein